MTRILQLVGAFAVAALLAYGYGYMTRPEDPSSAFSMPVGAANAQDSTAPAAAAAGQADPAKVADMTIGSPDAKVKVIEYGSFTCPHCRDWHSEVWGQVKANYIDTGKVQFTFREVYFDRFGLWAGMIARCDGGLRYFGMVDMIYDTQQDWIAGGDPTLIVENLKKMGRVAGMNDDQLNACLKDEATAKALITAYQTNATNDDVQGTPTFIIDGQKYSNMGYDDFAKILETELAK
jgi:protein-disulfide isomerase